MHLAEVTVFHYPRLVPPSAFRCNYETLQALLWLQNTRQRREEKQGTERAREQRAYLFLPCVMSSERVPTTFVALLFLSLSLCPTLTRGGGLLSEQKHTKKLSQMGHGDRRGELKEGQTATNQHEPATAQMELWQMLAE